MRLPALIRPISSRGPGPRDVPGERPGVGRHRHGSGGGGVAAAAGRPQPLIAPRDHTLAITAAAVEKVSDPAAIHQAVV